MLVKNLILKLVEKWYKPFIFSVISFLLLCLFTLNNSLKSLIGIDFITGFMIFLLVLIFIGVLGVFVSSIISFSRKQITKGIILTITSIFLTVFYFILYMLLVYAKGTSEYNPDLLRDDYDFYDHFADSLYIPKNITIDSPLGKGEIDKDSKVIRDQNKKVRKSTFYLYNSYFPGFYEYDVWVRKMDEGEVYLKAFEITKGTKLSEESLQRESAIKIINPKHRLKRFGTIHYFTIDEGDEGKPYAARFEVWFKSKNGGKERKLFSKNYKIEGYQPD